MAKIKLGRICITVHESRHILTFKKIEIMNSPPRSNIMVLWCFHPSSGVFLSPDSHLIDFLTFYIW